MDRQPIVIIWEGEAMVTFSGVVSLQAQAGETVTIAVTKPDGSLDSVTATTSPTGAFSASYAALPGTGYKTAASVAADSLYKAAQSQPVTFDVALGDRTITLVVV